MFFFYVQRAFQWSWDSNGMSRYKHATNMTIFLVGLTLVVAGWDCKQRTAACNVLWYSSNGCWSKQWSRNHGNIMLASKKKKKEEHLASIWFYTSLIIRKRKLKELHSLSIVVSYFLVTFCFVKQIWKLQWLRACRWWKGKKSIQGKHPVWVRSNACLLAGWQEQACCRFGPNGALYTVLPLAKL